jgi:hypothetical protein
MTQWEIAYVDLWHNLEPHGPSDEWVSELQQTQKAIAKLGREGWEPVGEVDFYFSVRTDPGTHVRQIMFKRPLPAG